MKKFLIFKFKKSVMAARFLVNIIFLFFLKIKKLTEFRVKEVKIYSKEFSRYNKNAWFIRIQEAKSALFIYIN